MFYFTATCWKSWRLYKYLPIMTTSALSGTATVTDGWVVTLQCFIFCNLLQLPSRWNGLICNNSVRWVTQRAAFQTVMICGGVKLIRKSYNWRRRKVFPVLCKDSRVQTFRNHSKKSFHLWRKWKTNTCSFQFRIFFLPTLYQKLSIKM
jgi:hypothetical protein